MPWPVKDLDEWRQRFAEVAPNAEPEEAARLEAIARAGLEQEKTLKPPTLPGASDD